MIPRSILLNSISISRNRAGYTFPSKPSGDQRTRPRRTCRRRRTAQSRTCRRRLPLIYASSRHKSAAHPRRSRDVYRLLREIRAEDWKKGARENQRWRERTSRQKGVYSSGSDYARSDPLWPKKCAARAPQRYPYVVPHTPLKIDKKGRAPPRKDELPYTNAR